MSLSVSNLYEEDQYLPSLPQDLLKIAKDELREDENIREQALQEMRQWIKKTSHIKKCRLDSNFLLRFLRHKKFHVPMAQETLVRYIMMRQEHPAWFHGTSLQDPIVLELINRGVVFALPQRDRNGRRVIFTIGGNIDPSKHKAMDVMKAIMVCFESLLEDEENQILGFSYLLDESGITTSHLTNLWNPSEMVKLWTTTEKAMPMRHRAIHFMRLPFIVATAFNFAKNLMSTKLQKRIVVHKTDDDLKKNVDRSMLPKEYGGNMPMSEMIELFKQEIQPRQERLIALDEMEVDIPVMTAMIKGDKTCGSSMAKEIVRDIGTQGSFRRLEID